MRSLFTTIPNEFYSSLFCAILPQKFEYILSDIHQSDKTPDYRKIVELAMAAHKRMKENENNLEVPKSLSSIVAYTKQPKMAN